MISKDQIKSLFFENNVSKLSLNEFLKASKDESYRTKFRQVMRDIKKNMKLKRFHGYAEGGKQKVELKFGK